MSDDDTTARRLGRGLARALAEAERAGNADAALQLRQRLLEPPPAATRWLRPLLAAAVVLAVGAAGWFGFHRREPIALQASIEGSVAVPAASFVYSPPERSLGLRFSDGTRIDLAPGSGIRLLALEDAGAQVALEFGKVHASVRHRAGARWRVTAGPFAVDVIGTEFDVELEPSTQRLSVRVQSGIVRVSGAGVEPRAIEAGGAFNLQGFERAREEPRRPAPQISGASAPTAFLESESTPEPLPSASAAAPSPPSRPLEAADSSSPGPSRVERPPLPVSSAPVPATQPALGPPPSEPRWRALANARRFRESMEAARAEGVLSSLGTAEAADLLLLANTARLAGDWQPAEEAFTTLRRRFPNEPSRGRAAFWLGTIAFDRKADLSTAHRWFSTYLREEPAGELAREARGRSLEILAKLGERAEGRRAAEDYLRRYPQGPHEALARSMLSD